MPPLDLTLVLAATRDMGIGLNGTLPWTGLRKEMSYFARITKRLPPQAQPPALNAVIMGRKTWESIPPRFRPLKGRLNVVISRSFIDAPLTPSDPDSEPVKTSNLEQAVTYLQGRVSDGEVGRVFVIGGGQIYEESLRLKGCRRVLLTRVEGEFKCDTHFGLKLEDGEGNRWVKRSKEELDEWTGEEVPGGTQEENGTRYEFQMWEKVE